MIAAWRFRLRMRIADWIFRGKSPEAAPVILVQRRIYIVPSRSGYFFAGVLLLLLIASINYSLSLGFLLTFLLAGMGGTAMLHTFRNLAQLRVSPGKVEPVFAGDTAHFGLVIHNPTLSRYAVGVRQATRFDAPAEFGDVASAAGTTFHIPIHAERRGRAQCGRLEIFTEYPVGLFHSWSYVDFGSHCLVYPKPDSGDGALPLDARAKGEGNVPIRGDEEFQSLRAYRPGDTPRQIAWKALAREQGLLVKEFGSTASAELWLDFAALEGMDTELRLSRLTWWVMEAERSQLPYGLRLPEQSIRPGLGEQHRDRCLEALALFGGAA
ncbi:MAG: DUF58 domain-containing protein [Betaproteobacteria bacterium]|nr:DUF58 domain-containing protein [Betaproteobacteria bacterium]